ncbi:MAG: CoB--CoM heterodisulfide reductase iron-sulfur subunit A family protein, partial [Candidatus Marinimicrobia bacterium]|nr:CoB--CoM heterodisulfide reductase iron-sulfur subunit A family protein [Candidatus Neomarinimicrobiota bacterium]
MGEKIGIYICECGPNIANKVYIDKIIEKISSIEAYKDKELVIKNHKLLCSVDGKKYLEEEIKQNEFTHLVIAACSPKDHESTFINICKKTHLNPYLFRIVNIREQCAWIISDRDEATEKAIQYIRGSINRVSYQSPLEEKKLDSNPDVLVIGGGIAGIEAALSLASKERKVYLIEKTGKLGGKSAKFRKLLPRQSCNTDVIKKKLLDVEENKRIQIFKETELEKTIGFFGNFEV